MSKEITFKELLIRVYLFFRVNYKVLSAFFLAGLLIGLVRYFLADPVYESKLTAIAKVDRDIDYQTEREDRPGYYSSELAANKIRSYAVSLDKGNYKYLSEELGISKDSLLLLTSIEVSFLYPVAGTPMEKNMRANDYLEVTVEVNDNSILPKLEEGLKKGIRNDFFLAEKTNIMKEATRKIIAGIDREVENIERRQKEMSEKMPQTIVITAEKSLHSEKIDLLVQKAKYEKFLYEYTPFTVLTGFTPSNQNKNGLIKNVIVFVFLFLVMGFLYVFLRDIALAAKKRES
jgi:hypothetical protein